MNLDKDVCLRNYVRGVLVSYMGRPLNASNICEVADNIAQALVDADFRKACSDIPELNLYDCEVGYEVPKAWGDK